MMKQTIMLFAALLTLLMLLSACGSTPPAQETEKPEGDADMALTMEEILDRTELTEADFAGVDFADFVAAYDLKAGDCSKYSVPMLLKRYREEKGLSEAPADYTALMRAAQGTAADEELAQVTAVLWELNDGNRTTAMVIDAEKQAVYYGEGDVLSQCDDSLRVADLSAEDLEFVRGLLQSSGVADWQNEYRGTSEGTTGHFAWSLCLRLADGRTVLYAGSGVKDSGTPDTLRPMLNALVDRFTA